MIYERKELQLLTTEIPGYARKWQVKTLNTSKERSKCRRTECYVLWKGEARLEQILTLGVLGWVLERVKMAW